MKTTLLYTESSPAVSALRFVYTSITVCFQSIRSVILAWNTFWFSPADPAPLGLLRLLAGGMLFYSHVVWGLQLEAFLGPEGWNSAELLQFVQRDTWAYSFWWQVPLELYPHVHAACLVVLALFWIGCATRITSILAFLIHASYCNRAQLADYGLDQITAILVLYLAIGPSGAYYSVDSLIRRWWCYRHERDTKVVPASSAGLALRLMQVHYCVIYFFAGVSKLQGRTWWTGEALWRAFANYEYQSTDMTWLASYPWILQVLTLTTVLWEISFAYLVWHPRWKPLMLTLGLIMHLGIGACMGMWTFGLMMMFGYLCFCPPDIVKAVVSRATWFWPRETDHAENIPSQIQQLTYAVQEKGGPTRYKPAVLFQHPSSVANRARPLAKATDPSIVRADLRATILIVHHNSEESRSIRHYFRAHNFTAVSVESLAKAREMMTQNRFAAILCDGVLGTAKELLDFQRTGVRLNSAPVICFLLKQRPAREFGEQLQNSGGVVFEMPISLRDMRMRLVDLLSSPTV